jgi:hypothetical protein
MYTNYTYDKNLVQEYVFFSKMAKSDQAKIW